ncbi:hypothetical protein V9T40_006306 [Parthenolecanium corni]|uniref:Phosphoinositide phospholipase C n=1 Tax=Parthenolecanium corni TaxID=536013 RepID=A0AAN9Y7I6_9HEMI
MKGYFSYGGYLALDEFNKKAIRCQLLCLQLRQHHDKTCGDDHDGQESTPLLSSRTEKTAKRKRLSAELFDDYSSQSLLSSSVSSTSSSSSSSSSSSLSSTTDAFKNALHLAVEYEAVDVVKLLLRYGVDPESKGVYSHQPTPQLQQQPAATNVAVVAAAAAAAAAAVALDADNNNLGAAAARLARCGPSAMYPPNTADGGSGKLLASSSSVTCTASNSVSSSPLHCPLQHVLPKCVTSSLLSKGATVVTTAVSSCSPKSASLTSQKYGREGSPSLRPQLLRTNVERAAETTSCSLRNDVKDSGTKISEKSCDSAPMSVQRRVSWVPPRRQNHSAATETPHRRQPRHPFNRHLVRQRSFSLESHGTVTKPTTLDTSRKCVSLKSSPQISAHGAGTLAAGGLATGKSSVCSSPAHSGAQPSKTNSTPERSIMAELRRSSEIFKSILMNLSIKEIDSQAELAHSSSSSLATNDVDVDGLLATYRQRCIDNYQYLGDLSSSSFSSSSSSSSSRNSSAYSSPVTSPDRSSSSDESEGRRMRGRRRAKPPEAEPPPPPFLRVSQNLPAGKLAELSHEYNQYFLYELPPILLAIARGNAVITGLLLKYGANPNYQDIFGNTPLHVATCQSNIPWECILILLENGAQICLANHRGIRPIDLTLKPILQKLQSRVVDSCWNNLVEANSQHHGILIAVAASSTAKSAVNPARILRKLRSNAAESVEEGTSCASGGLSSPGSGRSRSSNRSAEFTKKEMSIVKQKLSEARRSNRARRKEWRDAGRKRQLSTQSGKLDISRDYMLERSLKILVMMSNNAECLGYLVRGLLQHVGQIINLFQKKNDQIIRRAISTFLHNTLRTAVNTFPQSGSLVTDADELERNKKELVAVMCYVSKICLYLIHSVHGAQYTAMLILNKIIDLSVIHQLTLKKTKLSTALQHPCKIDVDSCSSQEYESPSCFSRKGSQNRSDKTFAKRPSFIAKSEAHNQNKKVDLEEKEECVLGAMTSMHASSVLNTLHNALTLFKRVISSHRTCTPSKRSLNCSYHCLQLLSGRVLVFMTQNEDIQDELLQEQQLRILAATLDVTHDPQLLLLMLQVFANAALHPKHHRALVDHGIPDLLSQLLLPSDDWYYNAHSTKYGLFVKHHVSRVLVYLGLQHRVNYKYSVFEYHIQEELREQQRLLESQQQSQQLSQGTSQNRTTNAQLLTQLLVQQLQQEPTRIPEYDTESETPKNEKDYITYTSICPSLVVNETSNILSGISVEYAVYNTLRVIESTLNQPPVPFESSTLHWVVSGFFYGQINNSGQLASRRLPSDPNSILFAQNFMFCFPFVINPVVVLRLLSHRLMTTAPLHRWKSSASRSSFGSVITHDVPRSPRSRASSTETETSTLRKRRKVNLTLDCANWANDINAANDENCSLKANRPTPRPSQCRESSISSASGLGIEPAMQAISAVSNMLRYAPSRDSIRSTGSCDERRNYLALNLQHKAKNAFRFSSLKHQNKRRSKSQANICKMEHAGRGRETAEQDILAFQKQLQNLPDFDSPDNPNNQILDATLALTEFVTGRLLIRPRSRSMPRVTYESSRYLTLPDTGFGCRLPRGRSAGALGFQTDLPSTFGQMLLSSPVTTPTDDRRPSGAQPIALPSTQVLASCNSNSRRSSLSPASDRNTRRRDSPACLQMEVPSRHRAILSFVEDWMKISRVELEHNSALNRELREFLSRVATCGAPYQQWCADMKQEFPALNKDPDLENVDDHDDIDREYYQLVNQVISGSLPCNKEEAAVLAGIHLRIEETWGRPNRFLTHSPLPLTPFGDEDVTTLKPISEDKESFLLEVPTFGGHTGPKIIRPVSPLAEDAENEEENDFTADSKKMVCSSAGSAGSASSAKALEDLQHSKPSGNSLLRKCYPSSSNQVSSLLPAGRRIEDFLPPSYLGSKGMGKLIKIEFIGNIKCNSIEENINAVIY